MLEIDCEKWARAEVRRRRSEGEDARLLHIAPRSGNPKERISDFFLEAGGIHPHSWQWFYHYAVFVDGVVSDQSYLGGIPFEDYKSKFAYRDGLNFVVMPATAV